MLASRSELARGALLLTLLGAGCARVDPMREVAAPLPGLPRPGQAMVVFVRPSSYAAATSFPLYAFGHGFLGVSRAASWFAVELPAGPVTFCLESSSPAVLRAALAPGKTYYVQVDANWGFWSTGGDLLALKPSSESWSERERWLAESRGQILTDPRAFDGEDVAEALADCKEQLSSYNDYELAERTLQRKDGR